MIKILKETGLDKILDFAESGAVSLATKQLQEFSVNLVNNIATYDNNSSIKFNGKELIIEIHEDLYSDVIEKFRNNLTEITTNSIKTINFYLF